MVTRSILRPVLRPVTRAVSDTIRGFNPRSLFAAGEQGIWLDPSDFSTLFQDSAGTTPVTAVGQPVGLALDKRLGLARGSELSTNDFSSNLDGWYVGANITSAVASGGEAVVTFAGSMTSTAGNWFGLSGSYTAGDFYEVVFDARYISGPAGNLQCGAGFVNNLNISSATNAGVKTRYRTFAYGSASSPYATIEFGGPTGSVWAIDNVSVKKLPGNHAYQTTSASRPTLQQDSNGMYYLSFDGTDDSMATPSIDFTGTDKVTVWAGAKSNSAAANGTLVELSSTIGAGNPGSMAILWPRLPYAVNFALAGTALASRSTSALADTGLRVISCAFDISSALTVDEIKPRVNGAAPSLLTIDAGPAGTGNYGNYPLYIGRRAGASLPFNGRIYQLIVRGAESNAGQIAAGEAWCNSKTRAY